MIDAAWDKAGAKAIVPVTAAMAISFFTKRPAVLSFMEPPVKQVELYEQKPHHKTGEEQF
jgi:hypothetical protein